jgi:hypothetical protein
MAPCISTPRSADRPPENSLPFLERMQLSKPGSSAEGQMQKTVLLAMRLAGVI